jgi:hypothetical protein
MTHLLTWHFDTRDQARNVQDELQAAGIPIENYHIEPDHHQVRIIAPEATLPGVIDILKRHGLREVN